MTAVATAPKVPTLRDAKYSQSLERGLAILQCFTSETQLLGIADIADMLGMSKATTHRYVVTLVALSFLEQPANARRKYRLGPKVHDIGMAALNARQLRPLVRPHLQRLRNELSYTVSVGVLDGDLLIIDRLPGHRGHARLKLNLGVGSRLPAYCTSMGKILLAHLLDDKLDDAIGGVILEEWGPNTIRSKRALREELEQIHAVGFAIDNEESAEGARGIAVPVRSKTDNVVAAIEVSSPSRLATRQQVVERFGPVLLGASEQIATELDDEPPFKMKRLGHSNGRP